MIFLWFGIGHCHIGIGYRTFAERKNGFVVLLSFAQILSKETLGSNKIRPNLYQIKPAQHDFKQNRVF